jgi:hypothetical protein
MSINARLRRLSMRSMMSVMLIISPIVGIIDVVTAYRHHDLKDAIVVVSIYFVGAPLFALWWLRKHPIPSDGQSSPRSQQ